MSHISSSRMPHAYATPTPKDDDGLGETLKRDVAVARNAVGGVSRNAWVLGALGIGAVGAALYASFRPAKPAPRKRRGPGRKPAARRAKAAA
ncbi:hypothetical protein [Sphingomonas sp. MMS24-J13]|uniref:hypothetical protein n=1 Tax=Sphingomonas sp. MMS24-J13 TaxID=3238686 RepID=UPI0038502428